MKRLSGLDASFLYLETPEQLLHVCGLMVLSTDSMPDGYAFDSMKAAMGERVVAVPEFRQRLRHVPLDLDHPVWVEDDEAADVQQLRRRLEVEERGIEAAQPLHGRILRHRAGTRSSSD